MAERPVEDQVVVVAVAAAVVVDAVVVEGVVAGVGRMGGGRAVAFGLEVVGVASEGALYLKPRAPAVACQQVTLDEVVAVAVAVAVFDFAHFGRKNGLHRSHSEPATTCGEESQG